MIRTKTVFVVGAGASHELGFPLGGKLLEEIGQALNFMVSYNDITSGNRQLWRELLAEARRAGKTVNEYQHAAWRVRDAAHLGLSIDNLIHQLNDDALVTFCAKLGIAHQLLIAEGSCHLRIHENNRTMTWPNVRGTWLGGLAQLIVQDKERRSIDDIFDNLSIISFNYDRTIQRFLPFALASQFAISDQKAKEICQRLPIYHPYGSLGLLPWESPTGSVEFGDTDGATLSTVATNIRTFTEQIEDEDHLAPMREAIGSADRIVFLGFGYLAQNMELLTHGVSGTARQILGTSVGLSEPDQELVTNQLTVFFPEHLQPHKVPRLAPLRCAEFLHENFRTLTS